MTKQEIIKSKWIELIGEENFNNIVIDEKGFFDTIGLKYKDFLFLFNGQRNLFETNYRGLYRPKSLQGIETNNGWIKIESESDLPKEFTKYWIIDKSDGRMYQREFDKSTKEFFLEYSTHYQPIVKPLLPIY